MNNVRALFRRETLKDGAVAGVVLGVQSVPDGLAGGLLAGVNPIFGLYAYIAMPALAGLLMIVGYRTVKPDDIVAAWKTGKVQAAVMGVTFVLTMLIALQYAVLVGIGISMILSIIKQSNQIVIKCRVFDDDGNARETDALRRADSKLVLVSGNDRVHEQLAVTRVTIVVGEQNIYVSDEWVGKTLDQAHRAAVTWVEERSSSDG